MTIEVETWTIHVYMLHQKKYVYFEHNTILTTNTYMQIFYGYGHDHRNYIGIIIYWI